MKFSTVVLFKNCKFYALNADKVTSDYQKNIFLLSIKLNLNRFLKDFNYYQISKSSASVFDSLLLFFQISNSDSRSFI